MTDGLGETLPWGCDGSKVPTCGPPGKYFSISSKVCLALLRLSWRLLSLLLSQKTASERRGGTSDLQVFRSRRRSPVWLLTSELRDEGHQAVLLQDLLQLGPHVLLHVGLKGVLHQDPACSQKVVQPDRHLEHRPS